MATSTLPPKSPQEEDERYNTASLLSQEEFRAGGAKKGGFSPEEKQRLHDRHVTDQMEAELANPSASVRDGERSTGAGFQYENTGKRRGRGASPLSLAQNPVTALNALKKGGPLGLIVSIILGAAAFMFGSYSLLPVHLYENFLSKFDTSTTSYTIRTDKMLASKLSETATQGICTKVITIACKFSRPSNYMLTQLEKSGVTPLDKAGNPIKKTLLGWPNKRPATYQFVDSTGNTVSTNAADLKKTLASNAEFRSAFHNGLKTRLQIFSDSIFKSVAAKFGFTKQDTLANKTSETEIANTIDEETSGKVSETTAADTGTTPAQDNQAVDEVKNDIKVEGDAEAGKLAKSGMGNAVGLAAGGLCLVGDGPGIITRTARAYQIAQIIRFGSLFMTMVSAMKAGNATPTEVTTEANALTRTDSSGKSALDSFGMRNALYGDTSPNDDTGYTNLVPGGAIAAVLGTAAVILDSTAKKDVCSIATSPLTGAAVDAALAPETLGLGTLANIGIGALIALGISAIAPAAINLILNLIPKTVYQDLLKTAFGDITQYAYTTIGGTKELGGEGFGDALTSGVSNTLGQLANAGGNVPLSVNDAVAYDQKMQSVNLAYAQEDRATHSPLDMSNNNTMMGAFFDKLIPLYSQLGSLTGLVSSVGSIATTSFGNILIGNSYAASTANDKQQYEMCKDPALTDVNGNQVAAGPFCNIQYGIPTQYLSLDPEQVVQDLVNEKQIDPVTGEAVQGASPVGAAVANALGIPTSTGITDYYDWLQTCTDGKSDQAFNCEITDRQSAEYALYTIDHRVQKNMDNEDTSPTAGTSSNTTAAANGFTTTGSGGAPAGNGKQQTGAGMTPYQSLAGANFSSKVNAAGASNLASLPAGTFSFDNFGFGTQAIALGNFAYGADISAKGIVGAGAGSTTIEMTPNTSNKAGDVPTGNGQGGPSQPTNNLSYMIMRSPGATLDGVTVLGTDQGHLYNGVRFESLANPTLTNTVVRDIPGNSSANPGETFAVNFQHDSGTATVQNVTIDGGGVGASGLGMNSSSATFNINNLYVSGLKYSAGIALWQQTGTVNVFNWTNADGPRSLGAERLGATVNLYDPNWAPPTSGHDITYTPYAGYNSQINFYFSSASKVPNRKIVILTNTTSVEPNVHVYVNNVEQPQSQYISWTGV